MKMMKFIAIILLLIFVFVFLVNKDKNENTEIFNDISYQTEVENSDAGNNKVENNEDGNIDNENDESSNTNSENNNEEKKELSFEFDNGLVITKVGSYSGKFVEDGTDEIVNNVLGIIVTNTSDKTLQYCEVYLSGNNGVAKFLITTLRPNESMIVLESTRQEFISEENTYLNATVKNVVLFENEPSLYSDVLKIEKADGVLTVTNKSDTSLAGPIYIYYKNKLNDYYFGGITYRCKIDAIHSGATIEVKTNHFNKNNSEIMFITLGQ